MLVFGTSSYVTDPHSYVGLAVMIAGAIIGAFKHWADSQDSSGSSPDTTVPQGNTQ